MLYYFYMEHIHKTYPYVVKDPEVKDGILYCTIVGEYCLIPKHSYVKKRPPQKLIVKHENWVLKECDNWALKEYDNSALKECDKW